VNRLVEDAANRKQKKERKRDTREDALTSTPFPLCHFTPSYFLPALPAVVRPLQPEPVHRLGCKLRLTCRSSIVLLHHRASH